MVEDTVDRVEPHECQCRTAGTERIPFCKQRPDIPGEDSSHDEQPDGPRAAEVGFAFAGEHPEDRSICDNVAQIVWIRVCDAGKQNARREFWNGFRRKEPLERRVVHSRKQCSQLNQVPYHQPEDDGLGCWSVPEG